MGNSPGLYVHIPFCLSRWGYCAFVSSPYLSDHADAYLRALEMELSAREIFMERPPQTLFIGGGTPSALNPQQLEKLLSMLPFPKDGEATCEINPDTCSDDKLALLKAYGITRCSFGVQTFSDAGLQLLQRRHDAKTARNAVTAAQRHGFSAINIDLINGWPGQDLACVQEDLATAHGLGVQHVSCYSLIVEERSTLYSTFKNGVDPDKEELQARKVWDSIESRSESLGYEHYETSNFARIGYRCRHNESIWKGGEYVGIGLAAHSHVQGRRFGNTDDMEQYLASSSQPERIEAFSERLPGQEKARECAVFWLRLFEGIRLDEFVLRTGVHFTQLYGDILPFLLAEGALEYNPSRTHIRVPKKKQPLLDAIVEYLI